MTLSGSGHRIPCSANESIPERVFETPTEFRDLGGEPVYVASALMDNSVHPCKCAPHLDVPCRVPYGGGEHEHRGRYDVLPITRDMDWVYASPGEDPIRNGRVPVQGGYEGQNPLYHAYAEVRGVKVPGKAGPHLGGANVAFGGEELAFREYYLLCWREEGY